MTLFDNIVLYSTIATGVLLALVVAPIIILAWLRPILFKIALRNVQRRLLQSVLIIFGLTISTAVIGVSLNIGDTFYTSVRQNVFDTYGFTDIVIAPGQNEFQINADGQAAIEDWAAAEPDVDGALPLLITSGGALIDNQRVFRAAPIVELVGYDATKLTGFEGLRGADGAVIDLANLSGADVVLSAELATILEAQVGDTIQYVLTPAETAGADGADAAATAASQRVDFNVAAVAELGGLAGAGARVLISLEGLYAIEPAAEGIVNRYWISASGGLTPNSEVLARLNSDLILAEWHPSQAATIDAVAAELDGDAAVAWFANLPSVTLGGEEQVGSGLFAGAAAAETTMVTGEELRAMFVASAADNDYAAAGALLSSIEAKIAINDYLESVNLSSLALNLSAPPFVDTVKETGLFEADLIGAVSSTLFAFFGSFSIAAGVFLIILIFILLAASRQQELGISRAIGMKSSEVVRLYIYEGLIYAVPAAILGVALGLLSSFVLTEVVVGTLEEVVGSDDPSLTIAFSYNLLGLLLAFFVGMLLTLLTMTVASFFTSRLNIVVAIRGLPAELIDRAHNLLAEFIRVVGGPMFGFVSYALAKPPRYDQAAIAGGYMILIASLGAFVQIGFGPAGSLVQTGFNSTPLAIATFVALWFLYGFLSFIKLLLPLFKSGVPFILAGGGVFIWLRFFTEQVPYDWAIVSAAFAVAGVAFAATSLIRRFAHRRHWWLNDWLGAAASAFVIYFMLAPEAWLAWIVSDTPTAPGLAFIIIGSLLLVGAGVLIVTFLSNYLAFAIGQTFGKLPGLSVIFRLAVAHVFASRLRTGLILMTFSLVIFSMVVFAAFTASAQIPTADIESVTGGYEIEAQLEEPIPGGLEAAIATSERLNPADFDLITAQSELRVNAAPPGAPAGLPVPGFEINLRGLTDEWFADNQITLAEWDTSVAATATELWAAVGADSSLAVINLQTLGAADDDPFGPPADDDAGGFTLEQTLALTWPPIALQFLNNAPQTVRIVGIADFSEFGGDSAIYVGAEAYEAITNEPVGATATRYDISVAAGVDVTAAVAGLQAEFIDNGLSGVDRVAAINAQNNNASAFVNLFQGFMSIGLIAGTIGLGVVAFRSVVERRRTIGVARAIGIKAFNVGAQFLIESFIIASVSAALGVALGVALTRRVFADIAAQEVGAAAYTVPWNTIIIVTAIVMVASVLITIGVAVQAARIRPSETLRAE